MVRVYSMELGSHDGRTSLDICPVPPALTCDLINDALVGAKIRGKSGFAEGAEKPQFRVGLDKADVVLRAAELIMGVFGDYRDAELDVAPELLDQLQPATS